MQASSQERPCPRSSFGEEEGPSSQRRSRKLGFPANSIQYFGELLLLLAQACEQSGLLSSWKVTIVEV